MIRANTGWPQRDNDPTAIEFRSTISGLSFAMLATVSRRLMAQNRLTFLLPDYGQMVAVPDRRMVVASDVVRSGFGGLPEFRTIQWERIA